MRARIAASVVIAVGIVLGTSGCNLFAPQATLIEYESSDGVSGHVGSVDIRNAVLITDDGEVANLVATVVNADGQSHRLGVQYESATGTITDFVTIDGEASVIIGTDVVVTLSAIDAQPGSLFPVFFQYGNETGVELLVPVLDGTLAEYKDFVPTEAPAPSIEAPLTPAVPEVPATTEEPAAP